MKSSERIPIPLRIWWSEFCVRVLPIAAFAFAAGLAAWLWAMAPSAGGIAGVGEGLRSFVTSAQPGVLAHLLVEPFERVTAGQPVAVVRPLDLRMQLGLLQAEVDLLRFRAEPTLAEQNALDYERLRADLMRTQSELSVARARLHRSEREVLRNTPLYEEQLVSQDVYELVLKTRDADLAEVLSKSNTVAALELRLEDLRSLGEPDAPADEAALNPSPFEQLTAMREALVTNLGPVTLVSPIDGVVSQIWRQPLEQVLEGEPLLSIQSPWSDYVIGYLRQPYPFDPVIGQRVLVSTRERRRREFVSTISRVGAQVEIITNALAYVRQGTLVDAGLPIVIPLPAGILIRPGEIVDLRLDPSAPDDSPGRQTRVTSSARVQTGRLRSTSGTP